MKRTKALILLLAGLAAMALTSNAYAADQNVQHDTARGAAPIAVTIPSADSVYQVAAPTGAASIEHVRRSRRLSRPGHRAFGHQYYVAPGYRVSYPARPRYLAPPIGDHVPYRPYYSPRLRKAYRWDARPRSGMY